MDVNNRGACHDYAITKRAELLARGWPASRLLLAEVAYDATEDHLILVADGMVLDNLRSEIVAFADCGYRLVRMQSAANPDYWDLPK